MLLIACMFRLLSNIFKVDEVASNVHRQHNDWDVINSPLNSRCERPQHCGNHHGASSSSSSGRVTANISMNRTTTKISVPHVVSSNQTNFVNQRTTEECTAKEWADALYSLMDHPIPADATKLPSALISNDSSDSPSSCCYSAEQSTASSESGIGSQESTDHESNDQQLTLDLTNSNLSTRPALGQEEQVGMIGLDDSLSMQAHEMDSIYRGSFSNSAIAMPTAISLRPNPILSVVLSPSAASTAGNSSIWLTTTERRFRSADRHLFQLLDVQERRLRSIDEVWGRVSAIEDEPISSDVSNCNLNGVGICTSQSVLFGPEFYTSRSGAIPVLPRPQVISDISNLEGVGQERDTAILSEMDRLFEN